MRLAELIDTAARRRAPLADLLAEELGPVEADRLLRSHTRRVVFHLLRETRGGFLFEPAAHPLPATLRTPCNLSELVLEQAHPDGEEERWVDCIPAPEMPVRSLLRTVKPASADEHSHRAAGTTTAPRRAAARGAAAPADGRLHHREPSGTIRGP